MLTLKGELRSAGEKIGQIRAQGFIPAVYYGHKEKSTPCVVPLKNFVKVWHEAGESSVITLEMPKGKVNALIHDVALDPVLNVPTHVDFYVIEKGQEVKVHIPIEFKGVSDAVKDLGGTLVKVLHEIEVKALPENLPHGVTVDISLLATLESRILAQEINLPKGVTLITGADEVVASIAVAKEEVETPPMDISQIEVEKKGKKEEEGGEEGEETKK